jgi:hypothetical protein
MLKDHSYYAWAHGKGRYQPKYLEAFARDSRFQRRFFRQAVDSLHTRFPGLYVGPKYDPEHSASSTKGIALRTLLRTPSAGLSARFSLVGSRSRALLLLEIRIDEQGQ